MRLVFLDTVGLIALWDVRDQWHADVEKAYQQLSSTPFIAVTSAFVLLECANAAARRPYRKQLLELRAVMTSENLVIMPTDEELARAWGTYESQQMAGASIVDLTSFEIMRRLGISEAFTNDVHFKLAGFTTLF